MRNLLKSSMLISFLTFLSRIFGLIRDMVIASYLGAAAQADIFILATKIPNFFRRIFAEGAFSQAFIPIFTEYQNKDKASSKEFLAKTSGTLGAIITITTLIGIIFSPILIAIFGTGWFIDWLNNSHNAYKFNEASLLLKITFPYLWFITFVALSGAILNTIGKFSVMAFTPVLYNIAIILSGILLVKYFHDPAIILSIGVSLGGLLQFLFQIPFLKKAGLLVKPKLGFKDKDVRRIGKLILPSLFSISINQINLLINSLIATFLITGSISWLYYSERLFNFPLGIFGVAISTVILPSLSKEALKSNHKIKNSDSFQKIMEYGITLILLIGLPSSIALIVLRKSLIITIFMHGKFNSYDAINSAKLLLIFSIGLIFYMLTKVLANGFYSIQNTKIPAKIAIVAIIANLCFDPLALFFGVLGLAIASILSAFINCLFLYIALSKSKIYNFSKEILINSLKFLIGSLIMGFILYLLNPDLEKIIHIHTISKILIIIKLIIIGTISYFMSLIILKVNLKKIFFKK
ncbi:MAG: murein biosynthesis integral membrane protein MurJ [Psittacicella sp.]